MYHEKKVKVIGLSIVIVLLVGLFVYNKSYNISSVNIEKVIKSRLKVPEGAITLIKEDDANGIKAVIYKYGNDLPTCGVYILEKGFNQKYRISEQFVNQMEIVTCKKYLGKLNIIVSGDNREGYISYIKFNESNEKIPIEKDFFIKILPIQAGEKYNYYNEQDEIVNW